MALKLFTKSISFALVIAFCFAAIPAPVFAAASMDDAAIKEHPFKFYLDPALVPDMNFAKTVLVEYVNDMNVILAKNTDRRLAFDPETDIILTDTPPHSNEAASPLPLEGFEIWAYAVHTDYMVSYGGYGGIDHSGAGVLAGLKWTRLYDPSQLTPDQVVDYWTQINNMLHELAHVFGAGYGEYYKLSAIQDTTGTSPLLNINILDQNDPFWSSKPDFMTDPLLRNASLNRPSGQPANREALLSQVEYSKLTAAIMNGDFRNGIPSADLSHINIQVVSAAGLPIESAKIKIWSVAGVSSNPSKLLVEDFTSASGEMSFSWGSADNPHNSYDFLRLIKVYKDGYKASAKYVSIYDADITKLVDGSDVLNISIQLNQPEAIFGDVPRGSFASGQIEAIYHAGITGGCSTSPLNYCPNSQVTRAQMAVFLLRSVQGSAFLPASATGAVFGDVPSNVFAAAWIEQMVAKGITSGCGGGNYCPNNPVTRAQMAIFLLRTKYGNSYSPPAATGAVFSDVPSSSFAAAWIEQLVSEGITSGCGGGNYCPNNTVTRAQMAIFIQKTFNSQIQ
jgi:S-layer homology domain